MLPENPSFLIRGDDGQEYGPVELEELREWVQENRAGLGTEVRRDEPNASWHPWQDYPELIALLAEVHATSNGAGTSSLVMAPLWRRLAAWMLDIMLLNILLNPLHLALEQVIPMNQLYQALTDPTVLQSLPIGVLHKFAALVIIDNACIVLYFTACHATYGRTMAKALLGIRVVNPDNQKPAPIKAFVRALALVFSMSFVVPLLYPFFNPQRRALHDLIADTCVVDL